MYVKESDKLHADTRTTYNNKYNNNTPSIISFTIRNSGQKISGGNNILFFYTPSSILFGARVIGDNIIIRRT